MILFLIIESEFQLEEFEYLHDRAMVTRKVSGPLILAISTKTNIVHSQQKSMPLSRTTLLYANTRMSFIIDARPSIGSFVN